MMITHLPSCSPTSCGHVVQFFYDPEVSPALFLSYFATTLSHNGGGIILIPCPQFSIFMAIPLDGAWGKRMGYRLALLVGVAAVMRFEKYK